MTHKGTPNPCADIQHSGTQNSAMWQLQTNEFSTQAFRQRALTNYLIP